MGYLTIHGHLLTYEEYKDRIANYKLHGLNQFLSIYNSHKDRQIEEADLHWGEEIEYSVFQFNHEGKALLFSDAYNHIEDFNYGH